MTLFNSKRGYTLLFAVIVSSVVLSIAAFILSISRKQFIISSASRDSTKAIYAADSGIQCAVEKYFDVVNSDPNGLFATSTISLSCNGTPLSSGWSPLSPVPSSMNFKNNNVDKVSATSPMIFALDNNTCAILTFYSGMDNTRNVMKTYVQSLGYSIGSASGGCPASNPRTVERAIYLVYY